MSAPVSRRALSPVLDAAAVNEFMMSVYPQLNRGKPDYLVAEVRPGGCTVRLNAGERHLRPGNTVSGPSLFALADIGGYALALSHVGPEALAVTTNLNINFMRKAPAGRIDGICRILKLGRNLLVFDAELMAGDVMIAHATGTYSLPPRRNDAVS